MPSWDTREWTGRRSWLPQKCWSKLWSLLDSFDRNAKTCLAFFFSFVTCLPPFSYCYVRRLPSELVDCYRVAATTVLCMANGILPFSISVHLAAHAPSKLRRFMPSTMASAAVLSAEFAESSVASTGWDLNERTLLWFCQLCRYLYMIVSRTTVASTIAGIDSACAGCMCTSEALSALLLAFVRRFPY